MMKALFIQLRKLVECIEIATEDIQSGSVNLVVTDPPYGGSSVKAESIQSDGEDIQSGGGQKRKQKRNKRTR